MIFILHVHFPRVAFQYFYTVQKQIMTKSQKKKIKQLIDKYNEILLISMRLAVAEDFVNLIVLNREDSSFELTNLLQDKEQFNTFILKEFLKKNSSSVVQELKTMDEPFVAVKRKRLKQ